MQSELYCGKAVVRVDIWASKYEHINALGRCLPSIIIRSILLDVDRSGDMNVEILKLGAIHYHVTRCGEIHQPHTIVGSVPMEAELSGSGSKDTFPYRYQKL